MTKIRGYPQLVTSSLREESPLQNAGHMGGQRDNKHYPMLHHVLHPKADVSVNSYNNHRVTWNCVWMSGPEGSNTVTSRFHVPVSDTSDVGTLLLAHFSLSQFIKRYRLHLLECTLCPNLLDQLSRSQLSALALPLTSLSSKKNLVKEQWQTCCLTRLQCSFAQGVLWLQWHESSIMCFRNTVLLCLSHSWVDTHKTPWTTSAYQHVVLIKMFRLLGMKLFHWTKNGKAQRV